MFTTSQPQGKLLRISYDQYKALTQEDQKKYKTAILEEIRDDHQGLIDNLEVSRNDFQMKMAFYDKQARNVVGIFSSEFKRKRIFL